MSKETLNYYLSRNPSLYRFLLRAMGSRNTEKATFLQLVKDGDVIFDIGANRGDFTVLFSHITGHRGAVHSFEPVPMTYAALSSRIESECRFKNVHLNNCALGEEPGTFPIIVPAGDFGQASLKDHSTASWAEPGRQTFDCTVRTLDSYVAEKRIDRLDFIKIDVEGAELPALRGARETIKRFHPVIHCEYFAAWADGFGYSAQDLVSYLQELGYSHFYSENLTPMRSPAEELSAARDSRNLVCAFGSL